MASQGCWACDICELQAAMAERRGYLRGLAQRLGPGDPWIRSLMERVDEIDVDLRILRGERSATG